MGPSAQVPTPRSSISNAEVQGYVPLSPSSEEEKTPAPSIRKNSIAISRDTNEMISAFKRNRHKWLSASEIKVAHGHVEAPGASS